MTFDTLLIADRGALAGRVVRAARTLGLRTVVVHSARDADAPWVRAADAAVLIGAGPVGAGPESTRLYRLAVVEAARRTGAGAVHPGGGRLGPDADFAEACASAGLTVLGPTPEQCRRLGSEPGLHAAAAAAGVPLLPGPGPVRERWLAKARRLQVPVLGDGRGRVVALGDLDATLRWRGRSVLLEAPAPDLPDPVRRRLHDFAIALAGSVDYRSAGTVTFLCDLPRGSLALLEVATGLTGAHLVAETCLGRDVVAWVLRLAQGGPGLTDPVGVDPGLTSGHVVAATVVAEHPDGPDDPLAEIVVHGATRPLVWSRLEQSLRQTRVAEVASNLGLLRAVAADDGPRGRPSPTTLTGVDPRPCLEVLEPGRTTIQDWPGRTGFWSVGVPPSGPMDDLSFRLGNQALGNPEGSAGLEITLTGPTLRFPTATVIMITGAPRPVMINSTPAGLWVPLRVPAGAVVDLGTPAVGMRSYLLVRGGLEAPAVLGSAATFDRARLGGLSGEALRGGDVVPVGHPRTAAPPPRPVPVEQRPRIGTTWQLGVLEGPHGAPTFLTVPAVEGFYDATWTVRDDPLRTGVRLVGPAPVWARRDGGEAGLHPADLHPTPYAVGAVAFSGDRPVLLGPDGPSLGGSTCPVTVITAHRWRLGQLRPGDTVRFVPVDALQADDLRRQPQRDITAGREAVVDGGVLLRLAATPARPKVTFRRHGDDNLLVEYGEMVLDIGLRVRVHALADAVARQVDEGGLIGLVDVTPGVRSLQLHVDPSVVRTEELLGVVRALDDALPPTRELSVPSRRIRLPLSWDDPVARGTDRSGGGVGSAPGPDRLELIRRLNGLTSVAEVSRIVFAAEYLVLGLSHLGGPVATPVDPRHRLVSTSHEPTRSWTATNAVGIGGGYLEVAGMAGPGDDLLVGRTVPIWSTLLQRGPFEPGVPWLLRFFDRISWYPVTAAELVELGTEIAGGTASLEIVDGTFSMAEHQRFVDENTEAIAEFAHVQSGAVAAQRLAWRRPGAVSTGVATGPGARESVPGPGL